MSALSRYITNQLNTNGYTMDALDKALANASLNAKMNGEALHTENLDSIANPTIDEPQSIAHHTLLAADEIMSGWNELHSPKKRILEEPHLFPANDTQQDGLILVNIKTVAAKVDLTNSRLDALTDMITSISTTISAAASMSSETSLKHRSLHEWDDQYLVNELVERENDLMPFYYELLKRVGSPELQKLVMSSMQGKNNSMVTLAQLCAAMGSIPTQAQYKPVDYTLADAYKQLEEALPPHDKFSRRHREDVAALVNQYKLTIEQRDALTDRDFKAYQSFMNELLHRATLMERIPNREPQPQPQVHEATAQERPSTVMSRVPPQQVVPQQQYFGQATEEYIRQTNNRIGS